MKDESKRILYTFFYGISLIVAAAGVLCIVYLAYNLLGSLMNSDEVKPINIIGIDVDGQTLEIIKVVSIALLIVFEKVLFSVRIYFRRFLDFDKDGNPKKYSTYERLSRKEKDEIDKQKLYDNERLIDFATLRRITHKGSNNPERDMENLVGMYKVKKEMHEMAARMAYEKEYRKTNKGKELPSMHMCFMGSPGTGKTTAARIMAGFLFKYGYIKENKCIEVDGNFFKGTAPGETSQKTELLLRKAKNGVLFIDEAYSLLSNTGTSYDQEAIATIVKFMEDFRSDLIIIFAGYDDEMRRLISSNPGIFSRIKHYLVFDNYNIEELSRIFTHMANEKNYCVSSEAIDKFQDRMCIEVNDKYFGNARTVRNYLEKAIDKHATNIMDKKLSKDDTYRIVKDDIPNNSFKL